jgi:pimeloyl-ACP methyl ester carboxylesterase
VWISVAGSESWRVGVVESFRTADGRTLSYRRLGEGPTLVCHPGGPGFSSRYFADLGGLGADRTLILLNPRGTEGSDPPADPRAYETEDYAGDVEELRAHLALDAIDLLGHSHGGVVATAYAAARPERVRKLVLASTLARFAADQEAAMEAGMEAKAGEPWYADARAALEAEQAGEFSTPQEMSALAFRELPFYFAHFDEVARAHLDSLADEVLCADALKHFNDEIFPTFDLRGELAEIRAPTLVITGEQDFITGPVCAAEIGAALPGAETVILPSAGHMTFIESPDAFRAEVGRFLSE